MKTITRERKIAEIPTLEVVAEEHATQPLPLIVYYHGWQNSKELILTQGRKLASKGFRVILPDAMNHGERKLYENSSIPSVTFFSSIQYNIIEFNTIIRYFKERDWILDNKIGVGGYSMGGITTSALFTQHPEITAASIIMGTPKPYEYVTKIRKYAQNSGYYVPDDLELIHSWVRHYDLSLQHEKIAGRPLFIWHGTEDEKVPFYQAFDFYEKVKNQSYGKNVTFLKGEGEGHLVTTQLMDVIAEFFETELLNK